MRSYSVNKNFKEEKGGVWADVAFIAGLFVCVAAIVALFVG